MKMKMKYSLKNKFNLLNPKDSKLRNEKEKGQPETQ